MDNEMAVMIVRVFLWGGDDGGHDGIICQNCQCL